MGNPFAPRTSSNSTPKEPAEGTNDRIELKGTPENSSEDNTANNKIIESQKAVLEVPDTTMEGILDWVGEDKERAAAAIENEKAQPKPRKTLLAKLEAV